MATEKKERRAYRINWARHHCLAVGKKKVYGLRKRQKPNQCELCGRDNTGLDYHHWNDSNLNNGLWLCNWCHGFADRLERGLLKKYLDLRDTVDAEWHPFD